MDMTYSVFEKQTVNGETTKYNATYTDLIEAKKTYHNKIASAYATDGLEHVLCMVINDVGGIEAKEYYYAPTEETTEE